MARYRRWQPRGMRVWIIATLLSALVLTGCPAPRKPPPVQKPPEPPLMYRMLTSTEHKEVFDYMKSILGNLEIQYDPTLQTKGDSDCVLPIYDGSLNVILLPEDKDGESFLRAAADSVSMPVSEIRNLEFL